MIKHITILLIVGGGLAALIVYSQIRPELQRVSGIIETDEIRLGSRVGGRVAKVNVEEGDQIEQGQLLIELEPFDLLEREMAAVRELAAREANYQKLTNGLRPEEVAQARLATTNSKLTSICWKRGRDQEIDASRARLRVAQAGLKLAEQLYGRHSELVKENAISVEQLERTNEKLEAAQAMLVVRQKELKILELGTRDEERREALAAVEEAKQAWQMAANGYRQEEIDQAKAARDAAQAALDAIRRKKEELSIKSPISGRVEALDLQPGDMVQAGAPVLSIIDDNHLWVRAYVPQARVGIRVGQHSRDGGRPTGKEFRGTGQLYLTTGRIHAQQRANTRRTLETGLSHQGDVLRSAGSRLRPGMTADVWLEPDGKTQ